MTTQESDNKQKNASAPVDDLPYRDTALSYTHPDRLFTLASLLGMSPTPVNNSRVLSLAASDGTNLIAMAYSLPKSRFIGISNSKRDCELANAKIKALNLNNIEVRHQNIMDITKDIGVFDYIIAQGIFSWVKLEERNQVLRLCRQLLVANGVAYVNYNAYPGWRAHSALREMLLYHIRDENISSEMVKKSREFSSILAKTRLELDRVDGLLIEKQLAIMNGLSDDNLRHDLLAEINQPYYFHEFIEAATREELKFISDADFQSMLPKKFPEEAVEILKSLHDDTVAKEQYMDFFSNRIFNQTLLCHEEIKLHRKVNIESFRYFYFSAAILPLSTIPDIQSDKSKSFKCIDGVNISVSDPILKALFLYLSSQYPTPCNFDSIIINLKKILGSEFQYIVKGDKLISFDQAVLKNILDGYVIGVLKVFSRPLPISAEIAETPKTTELIRYDAEHGLIITNPMHESIKIDIFSHHLLPNLNGTNSIADLIKILTRLVENGKITLRKGEDDVIDEKQVYDILLKRVNTLLKDFARHGLLLKD